MKEESFTDEQYIATEGEIGDKFYIVVLGNVSIKSRIHKKIWWTLRKNITQED